MLTLEGPMVTRRHFCRLLSIFPLVTTARPVSADELPTPASVLHGQGVRLLLRGRTFEKAAGFLARAAEQEPADPTHSLALGCAYASRAASLAYAAGFAQMLAEERATYADRLKDWEKSREELIAQSPQLANDASFALTRPAMPPIREIPTKDDDIPYHLTRPQLEARLTSLTTKALSAWETGLMLSKTPEEKAQAHYIRGWGIRLLREYLNTVPDKADPEEESEQIKTEPPFIVKNLPLATDALAAFQAATEAAPDNPLYWQAKGDALTDAEEAKVAYLKSLERAPKNASLWYLLYSRAAAEGYATSPEKSQIAREYLQKAAARDHGNAWPCYEEASILFRFAPYSLTGPSENRDATPQEKEAHRAAVRNAAARKYGRQAIDLMVAGNSASVYQTPHYRESVPGLLAVAWGYRFRSDLNMGGFARIRELARAGAGYAQFMAEQEKNPTEAVRASRAVIGMGLRMIGDWSTEEDLKAGKTVIQALVGAAVTGIGYTWLTRVYEALGDTDSASGTKEESDAFKRRVKTYQEAIKAKISHSEYEY